MVLGLGVFAPAAGAAQATPYVPNLDPAYGDLDALIAAGLVRTAITGERPYSRLAVARFAAEAQERVAAAPYLPKARFLESLARLEEAFAAEIATLCQGTACAPPLAKGALRSASADVTLADSPDRAIPSSYDRLAAEYIDADVNPLLQKNQGRELVDGATLGAEALGDFRLGRRVVVQARPRVWARARAEDDLGGGATLLEGYARALFGNVAIEAGRNHLALGHGPEAGPMLSHNARGLDMVRVSLDRSPRLPWVLSPLGRVGGSVLIAEMGANRDQPHSKLVVTRGSWIPVPWVELGATLFNHQGGEGSPPATWGERRRELLLIYFAIYPNDQISDKVLGADLRVSVPALRSQLWVEGMTTDDHNLFRGAAEALGNEAVWIVGGKVTGLGPEGRFDVWAEGRRAGVRPHTHHQFTSGLTLDRRVIGDALGPLGRQVSAGVDWRGTDHSASMYAAWERYNGADLYQDLPGGRFKFVRTIDNPDERRLRMIGSWSREARGRLTPTVRLGWERVDGFGFTAGVVRSNFLAQTTVGYRW